MARLLFGAIEEYERETRLNNLDQSGEPKDRQLCVTSSTLSHLRFF